MAKKSSASSRLGKQIRASAESIWNKPLTDTPEDGARPESQGGRSARMFPDLLFIHSGVHR